MVFQNVGPGQEDPSLALHNAIFCTKRNYCATSSTLGVVASDAVVHKGEFISCTIYFFPGSDVYCSTTFFLLSRSTWFFSSRILTCVFFACVIYSCAPLHHGLFTSKDNVCWENIHDLRMKSMLQKSCRIDSFFFASALTLAAHRCWRRSLLLLPFALTVSFINVLYFDVPWFRSGGIWMTTFEKWFVRISIKTLWWETVSAQWYSACDTDAACYNFVINWCVVFLVGMFLLCVLMLTFWYVLFRTHAQHEQRERVTMEHEKTLSSIWCACQHWASDRACYQPFSPERESARASEIHKLQ